MNDTKIVKGYTVIYNEQGTDIGFIGIDDHSGGYPYFSSTIEPRNVSKDIGTAFNLLRSAVKMNNYYGKEKVRFDTMRVVEYSQTFKEIDEDEDDAFYKATLEKLTEDEREVLQRRGGLK